MLKKKESKIVNAIRGYISRVVPMTKGNDRIGFIDYENKVVHLKQSTPLELGKKLYAERKYRTWDSKELTYINRGIRKAIGYGYDVNLSELKKLMPHRSISSIRCKVLWYLNRIGFHIGTYTEKD